MQDADKVDYGRHCVNEAAVGAGGEEVPGDSKDDFAYHVCGEVVTFAC